MQVCLLPVKHELCEGVATYAAVRVLLVGGVQAETLVAHSALFAGVFNHLLL